MNLACGSAGSQARPLSFDFESSLASSQGDEAENERDRRKNEDCKRYWTDDPMKAQPKRNVPKS